MSRQVGAVSRPWVGRAETTALLVPGGVLLGLLALAPLALLVLAGFRGDGGDLTLDNFRRVAEGGTYVSLMGRTLKVALVVTVLAIVVGWPAGWAIARLVPERLRSAILGLVIVPYLTSQILLIYAFMSLIQSGGALMSVLGRTGVFSPDSSILYTPKATVAMLVYESVPTIVLVMYAASEQLDGRLLEAARSMGSGSLRTFATVVWPLSATALIAAFALTFVQTVGAFAEAEVLGGPSGQLLGNVISSQLGSGVNRPFAIALAVSLLAVSLSVVLLVAVIIGAPGRRLQHWSPAGRAARPGASGHGQGDEIHALVREAAP